MDILNLLTVAKLISLNFYYLIRLKVRAIALYFDIDTVYFVSGRKFVESKMIKFMRIINSQVINN